MTIKSSDLMYDQQNYFILLCTFVDIDFTCPDGFSNWDESSIHCYMTKLKSNNEAKSWNDARSYYESQGGDLAVIKSLSEYNMIKEKLKKLGDDQLYQLNYWLGLKGEDKGKMKDNSVPIIVPESIES